MDRFMITTCINFCTNEAEFLGQCIEEAMHFSDQILVSVSDHFFDGTKEDLQLLKGIYAAHPEVQFIQFPFDREGFYGRHSAHFWHNIGRLLGYHFAEGEWILFLDADEIVEGKRLRSWLENSLNEHCAFRMACYWYFKEAAFRAKEWEDTPLLACKAALHYDALMHPEERAGTFWVMEGTKKRNVTCEKGFPMIHHYSWVRNYEKMLKKVQAWGHRTERDWESQVHELFSKGFSGRDFVHGYQYDCIEPPLKRSEYTSSEMSPENVLYLSTRDIHKIDLRIKFLHD